MEQLQFENQGTNIFLVYRLTGMQVDSMGLGMLTNNNIPGFASAIYTQQDREVFIKYNVTAKIELRQFFSGQVNRTRLLGVFSSIVSALKTAEDYMLDLNTILLDPDYIFVDVSTNRAELVCVPVVVSKERKSDFLEFFKSVIYSTQFETNENCDYVMRLINFFNSVQIFSLDEFGRLLSELENERPGSSSFSSGIPQAKTPTAGNMSQTPSASATPVSPVVPLSPAGMASPVIPQPMPVPAAPAGMTPAGGSLPSSIPPFPTGKVPAGIPSPISVPETPANMVASASPVSAPSGSAEKDISLFYLLQHYNKENAAAYKAQKAKKKNMQTDAAPKKQKKSGKKGKNESVLPVYIPEASIQPVQMPKPAGMMPQGGGIPPATQPAVLSDRANFGETTVLAAQYGETTMLAAPPVEMLQPYLIRVRTGEKIKLNKAQFRIGKEKSFVDYFIGDNTAVSRSHANFIVRDGNCFVVDTNSTNNTYVNEKMIASNVEILLNPGDKIRLANEEFEFVRL